MTPRRRILKHLQKARGDGARARVFCVFLLDRTSVLRRPLSYVVRERGPTADERCRGCCIEEKVGGLEKGKMGGRAERDKGMWTEKDGDEESSLLGLGKLRASLGGSGSNMVNVSPLT